MNFKKKFFLLELSRSIKSKSTLISFLIGSLLVALSIIYYSMEAKNGMYTEGPLAFQISIFDGSRFFLFLPIISSFPFSISFLQEYESGMFQNILNKIKVKDYIFIKILTVCISSCLVTITPVIIAFIICHVFYGTSSTIYSSINFTLESFYFNSPLLYGLIQILFLIFFTIIVALLSLMLSTFTNKIISLIAPFVLTIITSNIRIEELYFLNLQSLGDISTLPELNLQIRIIYGLILIFLSISIFSYNLHKRCSYV